MKLSDDFKWVHIVGVGGAATSGLARILQARGVGVSGSDRDSGQRLQALRRDGIEVAIEHRAGNVSDAVDLVVHSAAVPQENAELAEARRRGIPIQKYAEFLGRLVRDRRCIAVAGTHGKTSTAGMLTSVLVHAGRDPSVLIGGEHPSLGGNWRYGSGPDFVVEACEYDRSFLSFEPHAGIITNLELDHPDVYANEAALLSSFEEYVARFHEAAPLVVGGDRAALGEVTRRHRVTTFGFGAHCDWRAEPIVLGAQPRFLVHAGGHRWGEVELSVPGRHSVLNALSVIALAETLGIGATAVRAGLREFPGMARRFQQSGSINGIELIDDYAHHPTEVRMALETAREMHPQRRLWAVFQAHQFGRLQTFHREFVEALSLADRVVVLPVYSVREVPEEFPAGLAQALVGDLRRHGRDVRSYDDHASAIDALAEQLQRDDVCVSLGAGDVVRITEGLVTRLHERS